MSGIDKALAAAAARHATPGFVAMAWHQGRPLHAGAAGARSHGGDAPMSLDTVFQIFSMTKAVTAVACMQLVEQGRIDLDRPAGDILPRLADLKVLEGFDADGAPRLRPAKRQVTPRHLLTHTSGFAYDMWNADQGRYVAQTGAPSMATGLDAALDLPLMFDPGETWEYGIGIDWAGKLVEAVSGKSLDVYFADHIFQPLGMSDTAFAPTPVMLARKAGMTMRLPDGAIAAMELPSGGTPEVWSGGGGLFGTAEDYLRFLQMVLNGGEFAGERVLQPQTIRDMSRDQLGGRGLRNLKTSVPFLTHDIAIWGDAPTDWGLSWMINREPGEAGRAAGSLAWAGLANTYYWADPTRQVAGVFMTQLLPFADPDCLSMFKAFERAVYDEIGPG